MGAPLLLKKRKLLRNVLVTHDSFDCLLDFLESTGAKLEADPSLMKSWSEDSASKSFIQGVISLSHMALNLGIDGPLAAEQYNTDDVGVCCRTESSHEDDLSLVLDCGTSIPVCRSVLTNASTVFSAMLEGGFSGSGRPEVLIPLTSRQALSCLLHYLYGCPTSCPSFLSLSVPTLLELVSLSDKFLLPALNLTVTSCIVRRCLGAETSLAQVYRLALQKNYPVLGGGGNLAQAAVCLSLVGEISPDVRARLIRDIVASDMRGDYIDDVGKLLRRKLFEKA